jgi:hypothetical protein
MKFAYAEKSILTDLWYCNECHNEINKTNAVHCEVCGALMCSHCIDSPGICLECEAKEK